MGHTKVYFKSSQDKLQLFSWFISMYSDFEFVLDILYDLKCLHILDTGVVDVSTKMYS